MSFAFGVDYYPEHWPETRWPEDARLMAEAGMNVVRLAEFAWAKLEPKEGSFDFAWLDRAIQILAEHDIQVVLGTPTASAPPWIMNKDTMLFRVDENGVRMSYGYRREYCPSHPLYHELSERIVTHMAEHYVGHPNVIGWQIDNEFGDRCYCEVCRERFQDWLEEKYGSLERLNDAWGTIFWSHVYNDWPEVPVPLTTGEPHNPGLALDFKRFASDVYVRYQKMQIDILRERCPEHFITHNLMGFGYPQLDYFELAKDLDFVSWDNYPRGFWVTQRELDESALALSHDTMRGLKGENFWVMEQQAGPSGWETLGVSPRPGELRLWAYQAVAHGADGMVFFRWRTARFGAEEYWHGVLDHDGRPRRRYKEVKRMGKELARVGEKMRGSRLEAEVAMGLSYDARFAFQIQGNNLGLSYPEHFGRWYRALHGEGVNVDIVQPSADISAYKLVIVPSLYVVSHEETRRLEQFVEGGGVLVLTFRSGVKDVRNRVVNAPLPGLLAELCGIEVAEYDSLTPDMHNRLEFEGEFKRSSAAPTVGVWCDVLEPRGAEVVARYTEDYYAGEPAVTRHSVGAGQVVYVGTMGDAALYDTLVPWLLELSHAEPPLRTPAGVEVSERRQGETRLLFLLNHTAAPQEVALEGRYNNLLEAEALEGSVTIAPKDVLILQKL